MIRVHRLKKIKKQLELRNNIKIMKLKIKKTILLSFICLIYSNSTFAQLFEDFEGVTFPPSGWVVTDNGIGTVQSWVRNTTFPNNWTIGVGSASSNRETGALGLAQDWLITSQVNVPANGQLRFFARSVSNGIQGSIYKVLLSTTTQNISAFTITLATFTELDIANGAMQQLFVSLDAYTEQNVYLAFVHEVNNGLGDRWILDNIEVKSECVYPSNISRSNIGMDRVTLDWVENGNATQWEVKLVKEFDGSVVIPAHVVTTKPVTLTGLQPNVQYRLILKSICDNNEFSGNVESPGIYTLSCNNLSIDELNFTTTQLNWTYYQNNIPRTIRYYPIDEPNNVHQISSSFSAISGPSANGLYSFSTTINNLIPNKFYVYEIQSPCDNTWVSTTKYILPCSTFRDINSVLFINFLNDILAKVNSGQANLLVPGYSSAAFNNFKHLIAFSNPSIYNFQNIGGVISFSFTNSTSPDISFEYNSSFGAFTLLDPNFTKNNILYENVRCYFQYQADKAISFNHINLCAEPLNQCTISNAYTDNVKQLVVNFLNSIINQPLIASGTTNSDLLNLAPYLINSNSAIYNFDSNNSLDSSLKLTFTNVTNPLTLDLDIQLINDFRQFPITDLLLKNYSSPSTQTEFDFVFGDNYITSGNDKTKNLIKGIKFCEESVQSCVATNPNTSQIQSLLVDFLEYIIQKKINGTVDSELEGTLPQELVLLSPYITDAYPRIYNFQSTFNGYNQLTGFSFSFSPNSANNIVIAGGNFYGINSSNFQFDLSGYNDANIGINIADYPYGQFFIKNGMINHIEFCPDETKSCTTTNPNTLVVKQLFINLINHLITLPNVPDGYTCPELTLLAPYVQPYDPVAIYNFQNDGAVVLFSFANNGPGVFSDIRILYNGTGNIISDIDLSNYSDYNTVFDVGVYISDGYHDIYRSYIKSIEFCPDELYCKKHIAIVVDESGSIDEREARKIRAQLKSFIEQQALINETIGTNIHVSLIGLSDSDNYNRPDHVMGDSKLTNSNKGDYLTWINGFRRGRVSPNSDYWKSGLTKALEGNPELVILITDGCQTTNASALKDFIRTSFNNNNGASSNPNAPHLYVIGLDNGFYVDNDTPLNVRKALISSEDPNLNPSLQRSAGENSRVTSFLRTSLKYLMEYSGSEFPINDKYNFIYRPLDGSSNPVLEMVDYFGAADFDFLSDEPNYIYNGSVRANGCGDEIPLDVCNNCLNFKPIPGKEYIVSAWVKEELKVQVKNYTSGEVHINFFDNSGFIPGTEIIATTSGDIIDEWQRIFKRFTIPSGTHYVEIALVNNSGSIPVYFDDVRIHPVDGSMKSFVYDPETFRLMSELDENNFSTFYEYDNEGGLIRVKKETSRGIKTIQETRSGNVIKVD